MNDLLSPGSTELRVVLDPESAGGVQLPGATLQVSLRASLGWALKLSFLHCSYSITHEALLWDCLDRRCCRSCAFIPVDERQC